MAIAVKRARRVSLHAFLVGVSAIWLFPLAWAVYEALRPIRDTTLNGYLSLPHEPLTFVNFTDAWTNAEIPRFYLNTLFVAVPGVLLTLLVASMLAFAISQFSWRFNLLVLMIFTAGNLLPPQVIIIPLYWI